jgi:photosystem II stability/assembly factor-like uncharacterized protein
MANTPELLNSLPWRLGGPFRGGRSVAVAGDPQRPLTFYFGACAGGVWKTDDAGTTWRNVSDGFFKTASVGAIAVADADPNVVYAGMGESCIRGNVSHGDGVYRSNDGGATWDHCGLADTRHIARVRVHPRDPDLVYVAAFGHTFGPHEERGVFRSRDGGKSWEKILYRNDRTGACDLIMDAQNPRVLYAALWEAQRSPWELVSGGEGSGIFKTTDGGDTWTELTNNPGLPEGLKGRIGVVVSPANPQRVWTIIESKEGGLFRSDDGGATWTRTSDSPDLRQRPWYYMHIFADPADAETMYVLNLGMWKSTDGGNSFIEIPAPHGDNHDLWIDPKNTQRMIEANDGGACVTFDGGITWSSQYNQPTAQLYHVTTDTQFPYRIYGAQQDNTTISIPSYSDRGAITEDDTWPVGGGESGYIAVRPDNPNIVFAGSYASRMTRYDHNSKQSVDITVWPEDPIGYGAEAMKYRFQWTFPIAISPHDPDVLYTTGNHVFRSTSGGQNFEVISPDLTRGDPETLGPSGGPITKDNVSTEYYGTIFAFAESPVQAGVLWAGSDDGRINVSQDGGKTWSDVTPSVLPDWTLISIIEPSWHDAGTAYVAATHYKMDDFAPYFLKTHDFGATWQTINSGIQENDFSRTIREDPTRKGLLYAGTETGIYISWDEGGAWQRVENFPVVPIHDLVVHDDSLVIGTHGRSFWILDDLNPIRAWSDDAQAGSGYLFPVPTTVRILPPHIFPSPDTVGYKVSIHTAGSDVIGVIRKDEHGDKTHVELLNAGDNAPIGVALTYRVGSPAPKEVALSFLTADGDLIRRYSTEDEDKDKKRLMWLTTDPGIHRFIWDMRYPDATKLENTALSLYWGGSTIGPVAAPGSYKAKLEIDGQEWTQEFEIVRDPRITATDDDLKAQFDLLIQVRDKLGEVHDLVKRSRGLREQISAWESRLKEAGNEDLASEAERVRERLLEAENELVESRSRGAADSFNFPPKVNSKLASLESTVSYGDSRPPAQTYEVFNMLSQQADEGLAALQQVIDTEVKQFNEKVAQSGVPAIG